MSVDRRQGRFPVLAKVLLWPLLDDEEYDEALGDFEESYRACVAARGAARARTSLWLAVLRSLPGFARDSLYWRCVMIRENLKIAWRVLKKQKLNSLLNITGLGVSLACLLLILFHVRTELGYENGFPKADRIFRVRTDSVYGSTIRNWAASAPALGTELAQEFPEIEAMARLTDTGPQIIVFRPAKGAERRFEETGGLVAEATAIPMFDLEFVKGDPATALEGPGAIVLTEALARKYFGTEDPIGETLTSETWGQPLRVTGVIHRPRGHSHLEFDYLVSMPTFTKLVKARFGIDPLGHRTWKVMWTYMLLRDGRLPADFDARAAAFMKRYHADDPNRAESVSLQPIRRIHLHSKLEGEPSRNSDIAYVLVFAGAALLILLIAVVNFVNLATAQSFKRSKEIGVRKVLGARRGQLIRQHLGEAALVTGLAAVLALLIVYLALPLYGRLTGSAVSLSDVLTPAFAGLTVALLAALSLLAGFYPAVLTSAFAPVEAITSGRNPRTSAALLRKGLVVFQFVVSVFLIFCTITMARQLGFFHRADLGFDKDNLIAVKLYGTVQDKIGGEATALKEEIRRHSGVTGVALTSQLFGTNFSNERLTPVGTPDRNALPMLRFLRVDDGFIRTAGLTLVKGRDFEGGAGRGPEYIVSESTAAILGLAEPLGVECLSDLHGGHAPIVGVIKDFHFASLHNPIEPLVLEYTPSETEYLLVRTQAGKVPEILKFLEAKVHEVAPDFLFSYEFVDDVFGRNYQAEDRSYALFRVFSTVALFVACMGLFGLAVYAAESRVKEIGIRKTLGASVPAICVLLSRPFLAWVLVANALALPAAYLAMQKWLRNFAFHAEIRAWMFAAAALLVLLFSGLTVGYLALRSARENPVRSLRYE
jgi:putative ABC transport system permease protein